MRDPGGMRWLDVRVGVYNAIVAGGVGKLAQRSWLRDEWMTFKALDDSPAGGVRHSSLWDRLDIRLLGIQGEEWWT